MQMESSASVFLCGYESDIAGGGIPRAELYKKFQQWCNERDMRPCSSAHFGRMLRAAGVCSAQMGAIVRVRVYLLRRLDEPRRFVPVCPTCGHFVRDFEPAKNS